MSRRIDQRGTAWLCPWLGDIGVGVAVFGVFPTEVAFEEVAADRGPVDFVFAVEGPGHGDGAGGVRDGEAFGGCGEEGEFVVGPEGGDEVGATETSILPAQADRCRQCMTQLCEVPPVLVSVSTTPTTRANPPSSAASPATPTSDILSAATPHSLRRNRHRAANHHH